MNFSLIIPCYNEEKNLPYLFEKCFKIFKDEDIEIIFINNGSIDNSKLIFKNLLKQYPKFKFINIDINKGYGNGIMEGLKSAKGEVIGWTHADLETDPNDVIKAINFYKKNGYEYYVKGKRAGRISLMTLGMSFLSSLFLRKLFWDINAQPTMFNRKLLEKFTNPPEGFTLDLYSYFIAKKNKVKIARFKVKFGKRKFGVSSWKINFKTRFIVIIKTIFYILKLSI